MDDGIGVEWQNAASTSSRSISKISRFVADQSIDSIAIRLWPNCFNVSRHFVNVINMRRKGSTAQNQINSWINTKYEAPQNSIRTEIILIYRHQMTDLAWFSLYLIRHNKSKYENSTNIIAIYYYYYYIMIE